ncbi:MAG TPA: hypothetical protein DEB17_01675 [Chlorobaculum sp.]|uniref:Uncharacterized protein n=1 Tax=Chlorobaculum tepidum (strain ATCC 49652 / DSM 12025 / NBRC 103806 / TLS) TaxID=194439 RepID=Q8KDE8_CHLTE|nr:hypothetical protein CT1104 [Chlorobaculum tepidum TLS]HBU22708.1 hypothetical protein [Chlorobaculum sp.]
MRSKDWERTNGWSGFVKVSKQKVIQGMSEIRIVRAVTRKPSRVIPHYRSATFSFKPPS